MANWDAPGEWYAEEGVSLHKGGNPTFAMTPTAGTWSFDFVLQKGKALKWFFDYQDSKSFIFYQLEPKKDFIRKDGKGAEFRIAHGLPVPAGEPYRYQVQVEVSKTSIVTRVNGRVLDSYTPGRDPSTGKFGLQVPRADVFGLANFRFQPR